MTELEMAVTRTLAAAGLLARAMYERGDWSMSIDGTTYPASRILADDRIVFHARVDAPAGEHSLDLLLDGELVSSRVVAFTGGEVDLNWTLFTSLLVAA